MVPDLTSAEPSAGSLDLPARRGVTKIVAHLLGLSAVEDYYRTLPTCEGLAACADRILFDQGIDVSQIHATARCIPERGALLVTSNHPTGILDGVLLLSALLSRRKDIRIVSNDILHAVPVLADRVIPIKKSSDLHRQNHHALLSIRRSWKRMECVIAFPAGTVAHWQWQEMRIADAPWTDGIQRFATKLDIPEYRSALAIKNPNWFHGCAAVSQKARTALLLRAFLGSTGSHPPQPLAFSRIDR